MKQVAGRLKLELAQYREIESFASFAAELDLATQKVLNRGVKLVFIIKQQNKYILSVENQVLLLFAAMNGYFDSLLATELEKFKGYILNFMKLSTFLENFFVTDMLDRDFLVTIFTDFFRIT
jgi:F-type H+-transporting ATPase subunit alpha